MRNEPGAVLVFEAGNKKKKKKGGRKMRGEEATPAAEGSVELTDFTETLPLGKASFWDDYEIGSPVFFCKNFYKDRSSR